MSTFRSPLLVRIATIILLLLTNFTMNVTALPSNLPSYPAQSSSLDTLNTREDALAAAKNAAVLQKRDDTTTNENLPDVNPSTHGIPGVQSYPGASSKAVSSQSQQTPQQDQTTNSSPPSSQSKRQAQPPMGSGGDFVDVASTEADLKKQTRKGKGKRNCIQPVMGPDGEWDYTVAGGSIVC